MPYRSYSSAASFQGRRAERMLLTSANFWAQVEFWSVSFPKLKKRHPIS